MVIAARLARMFRRACQLEPEIMLQLAAHNGIAAPYDSIKAVWAA